MCGRSCHACDITHTTPPTRSQQHKHPKLSQPGLSLGSASTRASKVLQHVQLCTCLQPGGLQVHSMLGVHTRAGAIARLWYIAAWAPWPSSDSQPASSSRQLPAMVCGHHLQSGRMTLPPRPMPMKVPSA
jgi:hypothetical protein